MAAPTRAYWKGHIRLALVNFPVRVHAAVSSTSKLRLNMIHEPTGRRIRYQTVAEGDGAVDRDEIIKGYEIGKGRYVTLDDEELESLKLESRHTIDLVQFCEADDVDAIYFDRPYYVTPDGDLAEEAFCVIRDALRRSRKLALGQAVMSGKEKLVAIRPCGKGLLLETLRYAEELREAESYFEDISVARGDPDQVAMAEQLIKAKTKAFHPDQFHDRYEEGLRRMIEAKAKSEDVTEVAPQEGGRGNVINLMEALKASLGEAGEAPAKPKKSSPKKAAKDPKEPKDEAPKGRQRKRA